MFKKALIVTIVCLCFLFSCSKVNQENYEKLFVGMGYDAVMELLGEPYINKVGRMGRGCTWGTESKYIQVYFIEDKVILFSTEGL